MAKIKLSSPVADLRGALGQDVYSNWKGISYIRRKALTISNPQSENQQLVRGSFTKFTRLWLSTLTADQREAWEEYAHQLGSAATADKKTGYKSLIPDLGKIVSGKNSYIALNVLIERAKLVAITDAPLGINAIGAPVLVSVVYAAGPPPKLTVTWTDPTDIGESDVICLWGESPGMFHKQLVEVKGKATLNEEVTEMRGRNGVSIPIAPGLYRFQVCALTVKGQRSAGSRIFEYNLA